MVNILDATGFLSQQLNRAIAALKAAIDHL